MLGGPRTAHVKIVDLATQPERIREQAAALLVEHFDEPRGWPSLALAREEVVSVVGAGFARAMLEGAELLGWIGGLPQYQGRVIELHPIVVRREHRRRGIGRELVAAFEAEATRRGALTVTLGTDDDSGMTSLARVDLYRDLRRHIADVRDLGRGHPFAFYRRLGFVVTGVMPYANGPGLPDIYMSKPVASRVNRGPVLTDLRSDSQRPSPHPQPRCSPSLPMRRSDAPALRSGRRR